MLFLGAIAIVLMMVHINADVIGKYFFNMPLAGTLEIVSTYYMAAAVFLPIAYVQRTEAHIDVELITDRLPQRLQSGVRCLVGLLIAVYVGILAWTSGVAAVRHTRYQEFLEVYSFDLPVWPTRWFVPAVCAVTALYGLGQAVRYGRQLIGARSN